MGKNERTNQIIGRRNTDLQMIGKQRNRADGMKPKPKKKTANATEIQYETGEH